MDVVEGQHCDADLFRLSMSRAGTGVGIVTTGGPAGRIGRTVNSMASLSLDPPSLLFCLNRQSPCAHAVRENGVFCLNLLAGHQADVADLFASKPDVGDAHAFDEVIWDLDGPCPRLREGVASFTCRVLSADLVGTHTIFVGTVLRACSGPHRPLIYADRRYSSAQPIARA